MRKIALFNRAIPRPGSEVADGETFADAYQLHLYAVFNYCLFRVQDREMAEDLAADTFERAWQNRHRYNPNRAAFQTWLLTIARNIITDWQRSQSRRPLVRLTDQQPSSAPLLDIHFEESDLHSRLRQLVRTLEAQEQELIALKFGAGLNNREIAKIIDKSETAVGSSLHRAMQKLRMQWKELND